MSDKPLTDSASSSQKDASSDSKHKVTFYLPSQMHQRAKIQAAVEGESMSAVMEKALGFYLEHSDVVDGLMGQSHRVHSCPACESSFVMRDGTPQLLRSHPAIAEESGLQSDIERAMRLSKGSGIEKESSIDIEGGTADLVTC